MRLIFPKLFSLPPKTKDNKRKDEQKKSSQVPAVTGLLIPRIARLSNHVATCLDWLAFASIGFEGDSND
jgi:hypothetical protein